MSNEALNGKKVTVIYKEPLEHGNWEIAQMTATCGGVASGMIVLNDIATVIDVNLADVGQATKLLGKTIMAATANVSFVLQLD